MKNRITDDRLDGTDYGEVVYDEKRERRYQARIWYFLLAIFAVIFISLIYHQIGDMILEKNGEYLEFEYDTGNIAAYGMCPDGKYRSYNITGQTPKLYDGKIRFFYTDDINAARILAAPSFYIKSYLFYGAAILLCLWRLGCIYGFFKKRNSSSPS